MTSQAPTRGWWSRAASVLGWSLAALVTVATLGFLVVAGLVIWLYHVALPAGQDRTVQQQLDDNRRWAAQAQERLVTAAADGTLSDAELKAALGRKWVADRSGDQRLSILAEHTGTDDGRLCYTYEFTLPLGPQSGVKRTESTDCPAIPAR